MQYKIAILIAFSIIYTVSAQFISCPVHICDTVKCANVVKSDCEGAKDGIFAEHGSFCGCCSTCLRKIRT